MNPKRLAISAVVVVVLGTAGFLVGRYFVGADGGSEAKQPSVANQLDAIQTQQAAKDAEARFVGQMLGIYLAPSLDQIPKQVWEDDDRLTSGGCVSVGVDEAKSLDFARPLQMPVGYTVATEDSANTGSNPWALACSGTVRSRGWDYTTPGVQQIPAKVSVVRQATNYDTQSVAKSQVSTQTIGGRDAVVVSPASSSGLAQRYLIYFPESFGMTAIQTFNLDKDAAFKVAEAVAGASQ